MEVKCLNTYFCKSFTSTTLPNVPSPRVETISSEMEQKPNIRTRNTRENRMLLLTLDHLTLQIVQLICLTLKLQVTA